MNSVESVANSRRVWYDHSGKLLTKVDMPQLPSIANSIANSCHIVKNVGSGENGQAYRVPSGKQ